MMSHVIRQETAVFLLSVAHGALLTLVYDFFRALRRVFLHSAAAVAAEDFFFWLAAAFLTFCLAFLKTDGVIRGYVAVGIVLGAVVYHVGPGKIVLRGLCFLFRAVKRLGGTVKKCCIPRKKGVQ